MPVFSRLLPVIASAYGLQAGSSLVSVELYIVVIHQFLLVPVLAGVFVPQANEKYYDLGGAMGFLSTTFASLYYPSLKAKFWDRVPGAISPNLTSFAPRQLLLTGCLTLWSARLGSFLVSVRDSVTTLMHQS